MKSRQTDNYFRAKTPGRETFKMLMLLSRKFCCLSYMTFLAAILDTVVQYLREVSVHIDMTSYEFSSCLFQVTSDYVP